MTYLSDGLGIVIGLQEGVIVAQTHADKVHQDDGRVELDMIEVAKLTDQQLISILLALRDGECQLGSSQREEVFCESSHEDIVIDEVELGQMLNQREAPVEVDNADKGVVVDDLSEF